MDFKLYSIFVAACLLQVISSTELTFELEDNARECFHESILNKTKCTLEFQVVTGGNYDVDVSVKDPSGKVLYDEKKKQYDSVEFVADDPGEYVFCFGNEFSSIAHKTVYIDFQYGNEPSLPVRSGLGMNNGQITLTMLETSTVQIHESLKSIIDYQTHHRLREAKSRSMAEYLYERVNYWSIGQTIIIVAMSVIQVFTLRNFFAQKKDRL